MSDTSPARTAALLAWLERRSPALAGLIALLFTASGLLTLNDYGLAWDEGLGNLFLGERYFYYFQTFQQKFLDFKTELAINRSLPLNTFLSPMHAFPHEFPPVMDTLSAASLHLISYRLGWLAPVSAFHLPTVLLAGGFIWLLYHFAAPRLGRLAAGLAILFLATFPRWWGDMHFNIKDVPVTILFAGVIFAYLRWYEKPGWRRAVLTGVLFGLALGIKANAAFLPLVLILGVWPLGWTVAHGKLLLHHLRTAFFHYAGMALSGGVVYFLSWPYLYEDPLRVKKYFDYILSQGGRSPGTGWNAHPVRMVLFTTPEWMLVFLTAGLFFAGRAVWQGRNTPPSLERISLPRLLIVWFTLPILRSSLPGMVNFDGIRHFLEFLPAAALLAGFGAASLVRVLAGRLAATRQSPLNAPTWQLIGGGLVTAGLALNALWNFTAYHPHEHLYYNRLAGGFAGVHARFGDEEASDYWGVSYPRGMQWLSAHAAHNAAVYVPVAEWLVQLQAPLWLRPDIQLIPKGMEHLLDQPGRERYVMFITRSGFYNDIARRCMESFQPAHQLSLDGVPLLNIYRWEP